MTKLSIARLPADLLILLIRGYRYWLSPSLGSACRFTPSCSVYAMDAMAQHGAMGGTYLTACRLVRCQPWCQGGHDPVPTALFSRLFQK